MRTLVAGLVLVPALLAGCATESASEPAAGAVIAFGDSYTEGYGAGPADAYPAHLARAIGLDVVNKGVTGETAGESLRRLERDVLQHDPRLVIVEFGVNEAYRGHRVEDSLANIERIVQRIQNETNASIILVGVHFWHFGESFDEGLRAIAERHETGLVLDVLNGIVSSRRDTDDGDPALRADPFHPNARGYALMAQRIQPAVEAILRTHSSPTQVTP